MPLRINSKLSDIPEYPAASTYEFGGTLAKLASNESPFPPHPAVVQAIDLAARSANRYPDPSGSLLRTALAKQHGVPAEQIALGNGSCEILLAAAEAMLEPGAEIVYAWPSFSMYPHLAAMTGARAVPVPLTDDWSHDLDAMAAAVTDATRIAIICNPNNPTGNAQPLASIEQFLASVSSDVCVIVDEAYAEFRRDEDPAASLALLDKHPNLVLLRTFSKVFGLAGLRVGYSFGPAEFKLAVDIVRQPFSVNALAQAAATEALTHPNDLRERVSHAHSEREYLGKRLRDLGLKTSDSEANFAWVSLGDRDEKAIVDKLAQQGIIVRAGAALGAEGHLRVTYGDRSENERFISALSAHL